MKQFLKTLAISLLLTFPSVITFSQVPLNWTVDEVNPGEDVTIVPDGSFFTEGIKSCHLQLNSGAVPYLLSDVFYVTPGVEYEFSFDVFDNDTAGQVKVYADFYDTYGFEIFGLPPVFSSDSSEWQTISREGTVPNQAVVGYVLVKFYNQPDLYHFNLPANIWLDKVQFKQAGGDNLVSNGGFENWNVGIEESGNEHEALSVYPNPAKDFLNIDLPGNVTAVIISDMTGREVYREEVSGKSQLQLDLVHLTDGIYQVIACLENSPIFRKKFIKL